MTNSTLLFEKKDRVGILTLNRPEVMNAIDWTLNSEIVKALDELEHDEDVYVIVITGNGRGFCAGRDLNQVPQNAQANLAEAISAPAKCSKPVIAAVNGYAITAGLEFALKCDIVIAAENAQFAATNARLGLMPGHGLSQSLPRQVGTKKAKEMTFTGNFLAAKEALQCGLVNNVVAPGDLMASALKMATDIAGCDQTVVRKMKRLIDKGEGWPLETALMMEQLENLRHRQALSADAVESRRKATLDRGRSQVKAG